MHRMMLLGIFLGVASCWCLLFGSGNLLFSILGGIALPLLALLCFVVGFTAGDSKENTTVPHDGKDKE